MTFTKTDTGKCICDIVKHNITEASDPNRRIYGFSVNDSPHGLPNDTYMTRLEPLDEVVGTLCKNAGIGYDVEMRFSSELGDSIVLNVIKPTDRSADQTDVPRVIFSKSFLNVENLSREIGIDSEKNAIYAINGSNIDDAVVKLVNRDGKGNADYGVYRRETTVNVNCDIDEIDSYALKQAEDCITTDSFVMEVMAAESYKKEWFVGDIVTFRHKEISRNVPIIAAEVQRTADKFTVKLSAGETVTRPVSMVNRTANKAVNEITQKKFDDGYVTVVEELPEVGKKNKIYVLEEDRAGTLSDDSETETGSEAVSGYVYVNGWKRIRSAEDTGSEEKIENTEIIKFIKNDVEYGVVGIHDVDGETSIALSITGASSGLALLDENGEKILEYSPNKREAGKPYEVKKGLWFYPVKSQNVPDFDGFYFPYPADFNELQQNGEFDPSTVDEASPFYSVVNSTMFCLTDTKVNELKNAGFKHVYNVQDFYNDVWQVSGYESAFTFTTGMNGIHYYTVIGVLEQSITQSGGISWESIVMPVAPYVPVEENGEIVKYQGGTGEIIASSAQEGHYKVVGVSSINCAVNSEVYKNVWKYVIEAATQSSDEIPKGTVRIYKDIFLMNGAKILNA